jgi:hypothetical protein
MSGKPLSQTEIVPCQAADHFVGADDMIEAGSAAQRPSVV